MSAKRKVSFMDDVWPVHYKDETREEAIRITLKKMVIFLLFLIISTTVILSKTSPDTYKYTKILTEHFTNVDFSTGKTRPIFFDDIRTVDHFWEYLKKVVIFNLYYAEWYHLYYLSVYMQNLTEPNILFENYLVGVARLNMYMVTKNSCPIINFFYRRITKCYGYYNSYVDETYHEPWTTPAPTPKKPKKTTTTVSTTTIEPVNVTEKTNITGFEQENLNQNNSEYNNTEEDYFEHDFFEIEKPKIFLLPKKFFRFLFLNNTGGFVQNLGRTRNESLQVLHTLYSMNWITRATRFVHFDFNLFNPNLKLFFVCKFRFEFLPCGSIIPSYYFQPLNLTPYREPFDFAIIGLEVIFIFFTIYYIIQEFRNCFYKTNYCASFWSYVNILIIILAVMLIGSNIYKTFFLPAFINGIRMTSKRYVNMDLAVFWQWFTNAFQGMFLFLVWFKLIQFFNVNKVLREFGAMFKNKIQPCLLPFLAMHIGFSLLGLILFGRQSEDFNNIVNAFMTLLLIIPGYFKYDKIEKTNKFIGPIYFVSYILLTYLILFFMLVSVIVDIYLKAKRRARAKKSQIEVATFLGRFPNNFFLKCCPVIANHRRLRMSPKEIVHEIRSILQLCNFSEIGIKRFFREFGITENQYFSRKNVFLLLKEMKNYKIQINDETALVDHVGDNKMELKRFLSHQQRFDNIGVQLFEARAHLEELTEIIEEEKQKRQ